jgi:hypothetical protein
MPVLSDPDRALCYADFTAETNALREELAGMTKAELRAALDAFDAFMVANAAAVNNAIPLPARTALSTPQKARLMMWVMRHRYLKGA